MKLDQIISPITVTIFIILFMFAYLILAYMDGRMESTTHKTIALENRTLQTIQMFTAPDVVKASSIINAFDPPTIQTEEAYKQFESDVYPLRNALEVASHCAIHSLCDFENMKYFLCRRIIEYNTFIRNVNYPLPAFVARSNAEEPISDTTKLFYGMSQKCEDVMSQVVLFTDR